MELNTAESVASIPEERLLDLLYRDVSFFQGITVPPLTSGSLDFRLRVTPRQLHLPHATFGDVDSLIVCGEEYESSRATEFKRVKVSASTFHTGLPNKLQELTKAVRQANGLVQAGFALVWLAVIVVVDAREKTGGRFIFVPEVGPLVQFTESAIPLADLDPHVGVYATEIVQPVDKPPEMAGMFGGHLLRVAQPQDQPPELTAAIRKLFGGAV